ncbi:acyl carrier protein [Neptuniibacter sp. QD37_6]|uniref:acyl carrier protein n=1 Tax=Neptuniibacter sp. QD37_6 TaxID=3398210 RepID=UPI0039F49079
MSEEIREKVQDILRMVMGDDRITAVDELSAKDIEVWDSMNHITLMVTIETEFGIRFSNEAISELENIGQLISLIESQKS